MRTIIRLSLLMSPEKNNDKKTPQVRMSELTGFYLKTSISIAAKHHGLHLAMPQRHIVSQLLPVTMSSVIQDQLAAMKHSRAIFKRWRVYLSRLGRRFCRLQRGSDS